MEINTSSWDENSVAIERGPLLYALKIGEEWKAEKNNDFPQTIYGVRPTSPWNYGILNDAINKKQFSFVHKPCIASISWNLQNAPVSITVQGKRIGPWQEYKRSAGSLSISRVKKIAKEESVTLIPYGCSILRIIQFSVADSFKFGK